MTADSHIIALESRAVVSVTGPDWRSFLQGLLTNDVETLEPGAARFAALLTPQGRILFDLFVIALDDGCLLDVAADRREALIQRLSMYRLRAKVVITTSDLSVVAMLPPSPLRRGAGGGGASSQASALTPPSPHPLPRKGEEGFWVANPRLAALGSRGYLADQPEAADESAYHAHRLALGVPDTADWGYDKTYPIEADFDLLNGIDFHKGCFVGQETTSRMHRRGSVKSRMLPIIFDGPLAPQGAEILAGSLRAGEVLSGQGDRAMALVRLDRIDGAALTVDERPVRVQRPEWTHE